MLVSALSPLALPRSNSHSRCCAIALFIRRRHRRRAELELGAARSLAGTVKRYLVTDDLPRLLTICLQRASSPTTPLQTQREVAAGLPLLHAVWIHMADRVMFRSEEATEARDAARKAAGTSDEPLPEDEVAAAAEVRG